MIGRAGLPLTLRQECGLKLWEVRLEDAYKNVAVREGSAREFENSFRRLSAHSFPVLNGSVLTGQILS